MTNAKFCAEATADHNVKYEEVVFSVGIYVDLEAPTVTLIAPANTTYTSSSIALTFSVSETKDWSGYSLSGASNVTSGNTTLTGFTNGTYTIRVYANDTEGNMGASSLIYFTIAIPDTYTLLLIVTNPANTTFTTSTIPINLTYSGNDTNPVYSYNIKFSNGTWMYLTNGTDHISAATIYENLTATFCCKLTGNHKTDYTEVIFTIAIPEAPPNVYTITITITVPINTTYPVLIVPIEFSAVTNGTLQALWWNLKDSTGNYVYLTNQTYLLPTTASGLTDGATYTLYCWASNVEGETAQNTVTFTNSVPIEGGGGGGGGWGNPPATPPSNTSSTITESPGIVLSTPVKLLIVITIVAIAFVVLSSGTGKRGGDAGIEHTPKTPFAESWRQRIHR